MGGRRSSRRLGANTGRSHPRHTQRSILLVAIAIVFGIALSGIRLGSELFSGHPTFVPASGHVSTNPLEAPSRPMGVGAGDHAPTYPRAADLHRGSSPAFSGRPYVIDTLVLFNNTLVPGNFLAASGPFPSGAAYDSGKGEVFVADSGSVSVISDATNAVVATVAESGDFSYATPNGVAYDSGKGEVFVANSGTDLGPGSVSVISDTTNTVVATIAVEGFDVAYDSAKGELFVANSAYGFLSSGVTVISDATNNVVAVVPVEGGPFGVAYDSGKGEVFVADAGSNNVSVISDLTNTVVATVAVGANPTGVAYDSAKGEVFVTDAGSNNVSVISDATNTVVATVPVGSLPWAVAFDWGKGEVLVADSGSNPYCNPDCYGVTSDGGKGKVFAADSGSNDVSVISDVTNIVVATVAVGTNPLGVAYDSGRGEVFVTDSSSNNVSVISDATNTVVATVTLGLYPYGVAYDSGKGEVFVTAGNSVSVISGATNTVVATVAVGGGEMAYDSGRGEIYVSNFISNNVSVISDATNTVVATVAVGSGPQAVAYDSGRGEVFVADTDSNNVSVISDATNTVVATVAVGASPGGVAYDSGRGEVFVSDFISNNVSVISDATNTVVATVAVGSDPIGAAYDRGKGEVFVANYNFGSLSGSVSVISDATNTVVASPSVGAYPLGVAYDGGKGEVFVANDQSGNVSVISDATNTVVATVAVGAVPAYVAYDSGNTHIYVSNTGQGTVSIMGDVGGYAVTFTEIGLPSGTSWSVALNRTAESSSGASIGFTEPNGTYAFAVGAIAGFTVSLSSGSVTVNGADVTEAVTFTRVTYTVTFDEGGLPSGTTWSLALEGVPESTNWVSIPYTEPNGSYWFTIGPVAGYAANPSSGFLTVNGADVRQVVTFSPVTYAVTFTETGLPSGTTWSVTLGGSTQFSSTSSVIFQDPNGTYSFGVGTVTGYVVTRASGTVAVAGAPVVEDVSFGLPAGPTPYPVTFTETGLPSGTSWSVTLGSSTQFSTTDSIVFTDPNGSYPFGVGTVAGYSGAPGSGTVTVSGAAVVRTVSFGPTSGPMFFGVPIGGINGLVLGVAIAAIVVAATAIVVAIRSKGAGGARSPPVPPNTP